MEGKSFLNKLFMVSANHPKAFEQFRSHAEIIVERHRQNIEGGKNVIHPYSMFSLYWNSFMIVLNFAHMVCSTIRLCFILETSKGPILHTMDSILLGLHALCLLDVTVRFNMGYKSDERNIVVNRRRIICHYLRGWFFIDFLSCLPMAYILLHTKLHTYRYLLFGHLLPILRVARLPTVVLNLKPFLMTFSSSYIWHRTIRHVLLFVISIHWINCIMYILPAIGYYWTGKMPKQYTLFLNSTNGDLSDFSCGILHGNIYIVSCVDPSMLKVSTAEEFVVYSLIVFYGAMFMVYTLVFLLKIYMTYYNSSTRFHGLMSQMEAFMQHKQLPAQLKKRLREFYTYRYQEKYYKEDDTLNCLSDQLRHEIILHTCFKLVNRLPILEGLPASVVGAVLGCLKPEVYLPNDLVMRAGDTGDCMYFIANGTVAVYSLKGAEICHLEDGDHFGEVALLMTDSKRVATVVSVEITQLYRLDASDFRQIVKKNGVLYDRLQQLASRRMHETVLVDDEFRRQRQKRAEMDSSAETLLS
ncbi:potassium/sodium hyperpolarization-activated cyclic nucleotide-gated channel 1-like [Battus philenor]|uniref:potassium/sodium hyperpolarization-activated cyclic nucleotide-gated channel 1-like n=1 Tax=Battus philenor TaxID=42288 RepID=UPI0035CF24F3